MVADYWGWNGDSMVWDVSFVWPVQDWEIESLFNFMESIYSVKIRQSTEDKICRHHTKSRVFEVKAYYRVLQAGVSCSFPWKSIWKVRVPLKVAFLSWTAALGKILTIVVVRC